MLRDSVDDAGKILWSPGAEVRWLDETKEFLDGI